MQIANNKVVAIHYTLKNADGAVLDSSKDHEPLAYLHGAGGIIPGLEQALAGKSAGVAFTITVPAEQAYGPRHESLIQDVPRAAFGQTKLEPGMQFRAQGQNAGARLVTVIQVHPDTVRIDANHPLAGQALQFDVEVVSVRDATPDELSHQHAHGEGGHHPH